MKNNYRLDPEEMKLEKEIENGEWVIDPNNDEVRKQFEMAAKKMVLKDKKINFRVSSLLFNQLKVKASKAGLSYQTLISTLLNNYVSGNTKLDI